MTLKMMHNYREEVVIPVTAIRPNLYFVYKKEMISTVTTKDNVLANIDDWEWIDILSKDAEALVKKLYNLDILTYMRRWASSMDVESIYFLHIKLSRKNG